MLRMKNFLFRLSTLRISMVVSLILFTVFLMKEERGWDFGLLDLMELKALDIKFVDRGVQPEHGQVAIAAIDEKSIKRLGRFPWNRIVIAKTIAKLTQAGASVIAFDITFSDEDNTQLPKVISALSSQITNIEVEDCADCEPMRKAILDFMQEQGKSSDPDAILAQVIEQADNVVLGYFFHSNQEEISHLPQSEIDELLERILPSKISVIKPWDPAEEKNYKLKLVKGLAAQSPLAIFADATDRYGYFSFKQDEDGALRWADLLKEMDSGDPDLRLIFPSLSLIAAAKHLDSEIVLHTYPKGVDRITLGLGENAHSIQTNFLGRLLINYHGPGGTFPTFSIVDILDGKFEPDAFKNKIVLVGATATAVYDLRVTPFQENFPGVEIHANILDNILNNDYIQRPYWAIFYELAVILFFGLLFGLALGRFPALWGALFSILAVISYGVVDMTYFFSNGYWVKSVMPIIQALILFLVCYVYRYFTEEREKKRTRAAFKQYLNESIVDVIMDDYEKLKLGGEKRIISVLFSDIRSFTTVSESLSPEELGQLLTEYMNPMTDIIFDHNGVLDKYIGDAIMAFWGAPHPQEDQAILACRSALKMLEELEELNKTWVEKGFPQLAIGIGVNTGQMWVGNMGSHVRFDYTVLGDSVNLGARLEGTTKQYGIKIIISEFSYERVKDDFLCRELDAIRVKGKKLPVTIYELISEGKGSPEDIARVETFESALKLYRDQEWQQAIDTLKNLLTKNSEDEPSKVFIERCLQYQQNPPPEDWDGVFTMTTK